MVLSQYYHFNISRTMFLLKVTMYCTTSLKWDLSDHFLYDLSLHRFLCKVVIYYIPFMGFYAKRSFAVHLTWWGGLYSHFWHLGRSSFHSPYSHNANFCWSDGYISSLPSEQVTSNVLPWLILNHEGTKEPLVKAIWLPPSASDSSHPPTQKVRIYIITRDETSTHKQIVAPICIGLTLC